MQIVIDTCPVDITLINKENNYALIINYANRQAVLY